jgi:hypothetical protein
MMAGTLVVPGFGVTSRSANRYFAIVGLSSPNAEYAHCHTAFDFTGFSSIRHVFFFASGGQHPIR